MYVWNQTGSASYTVATNWTPTRNAVTSNDILEFNGGSSVTVTNVPTETVSQIIVSNGTNVWLYSGSSVLSVRDNLTLTSGEIITDANTILTLGTSTTSTGSLSGSGTIDGNFSRWISAGTASYTYPMLAGSDNRSVTVNYTTAPSTGGTLMYQFVHGVPSTTGLPLTDGTITDNAVDTSGVFRLTASNGLSGGAYTGTFTAANFAKINDYTQLSLIQRNDNASSWTLNGTLVTTTGSNATPVLSRTSMTAYGEFGVAGDVNVNPLPVTMLSFTARNVNGDVLLNWSTSSEQNNKGFNIERSVDGKNYSFVNFVKGAGNSVVVENYASTDSKAFEVSNSNTLYYRLKQVDYNGKYAYSNVVNVLRTVITVGEISLYPNPSTGRFTLEINAVKDGQAEVMITDSKGQEMNTMSVQVNKGINSSLINLESASNGVYFVKVAMNGETKVMRVTKVN